MTAKQNLPPTKKVSQSKILQLVLIKDKINTINNISFSMAQAQKYFPRIEDIRNNEEADALLKAYKELFLDKIKAITSII
ncbi:MAG: hypothetical protein GY756_09800 [bacterium]|nr:hypothetical protein [bacterium]